MVPVFNLKDSIVEALTALGGSATVSEVRDYFKSKYGKEWKNIETVMDDLCLESKSSFFPPEDRVLKKIGKNKYSIRETGTSKLPETDFESKKAVTIGFEKERKIFSFKEAKQILQRKGQLSIVQKAASLTNLSSKEDHDKIQHFLHKNRWDIEVSLFPVTNYRLDAFKEKTGIEIERSLIDAVHRSLFRCQMVFAQGKMDVLVFIVPTYKEPKFEQVKRDLQAFKEIIPYPVYLIGVPPLSDT